MGMYNQQPMELAVSYPSGVITEQNQASCMHSENIHPVQAEQQPQPGSAAE